MTYLYYDPISTIALSGIIGRISLQTTVIDNCHRRVCIYVFKQ